jgi:hypothetical protein
MIGMKLHLATFFSHWFLFNHLSHGACMNLSQENWTIDHRPRNTASHSSVLSTFFKERLRNITQLVFDLHLQTCYMELFSLISLSSRYYRWWVPLFFLMRKQSDKVLYINKWQFMTLVLCLFKRCTTWRNILSSWKCQLLVLGC